MAFEQYANSAATTLNGAITNAATSLVVTSATGFPTAGNFRILVENEIMLVTGVSGTTFTVTRGAESTTGAAHNSGVAVTHILTKAALEALVAKGSVGDTFANRPAAALAGRLFVPSDGYEIDRDSGSAWAPAGPLFPFTAPDDSLFSWFNQNGGTITTTYGGITLVQAGRTGGANPSCRVKTAPSAPYTVTMFMLHGGFMSKANTRHGILFRDSVNAKMVTFHVTNGFLYTTKWNGTGIAADYSNWAFDGNVNWFQMSDDNTNLIFRVSADGRNWITVETRDRHDFLVAGPDQIGFFADAANTGTPNFDAVVTLLSYKES